MLNRRHIVTGLKGLVAAMIMVGATAMPASAKPAKWKKSPHNTQSNFTAPSSQLPLWAQRKISASEAKSIARRRVPGGEVVDISRNGNTYRVRVIAKNGKVVDVFIDANTGRVKR